LYQNNSAKYY